MEHQSRKSSKAWNIKRGPIINGYSFGVVVHPQVPGARGARRRAALGCDQNSDQALRIIINSTSSSSHQHQHQIIIITLSSALAPTPGHHSISISIVMKMLSSLLSSSSLSTLDHQQEGQMGWYVVQPVGPPPHRSDYTAMGSVWQELFTRSCTNQHHHQHHHHHRHHQRHHQRHCIW